MMNILVLFAILFSFISIKSYGDNTNYLSITPTYYCSTDDSSRSNFWISVCCNPSSFSPIQLPCAAQTCPSLQSMSTAELQAYFTAKNWTEDEILSQRQLYISNAYIELVKNYAAYPAYIKKYYQKYLKYGVLRKCWSWMKGTYTSGMAHRFRELHQDLVREETAQQLRSKQQEVQRMYHGELKKIESELIANIPYTQARREAINATYKNDLRTLRKISVAEDVQRSAKEYEIEKSALEQGLMNPYEYQLHTEFVEQLHAVTRLQSHSQWGEYHVFLDAVGYGVSLGIEANHDHDAVTATHWADYAWKALDIAQAVGEGIALGCYNTIMMPIDLAILAGQAVTYPIIHPIESFNVLGQGVETIISEFSYDSCQKLVKGFEDLWNIDREEAWDTLLDQIDSTVTYCCEELDKVPLREKVKHTTALLTELILPAKFFKMGKKLCTSMRPLVRAALEIVRDEQIVVEIAGAGENILMKASESINEVGSAVTNVAQESGMVLRLFHASLMKNLEPEIAALRSLFDNKIKGFGEFANKYLKMDYEHILGIDLSFSRRGVPQIGGFHHDYMHTIKKSKTFEFVNEVVDKTGFYTAELFCEGKYIDIKTFFPAQWSREQVINAIYEVYENFIKNGCIPKLEIDGKYSMQGLTKEGIEIIMYITKKGTIKTAYPILK